MKKTLRSLAFSLPVFAAIGIILFTGCYKQTDYQNSISATIDSIPFSAAGKTVVTLVVDTTTPSPSKVTIYGQTSIYTPGTAVQPSIKLIVPNAEGTYYFPSQASATVVTSSSGSGGTVATSGYIVVLNNASGRLQGNFTFTCADGTKVNNGQYTGIMSFD